ncbi:magnesium transporter [Corynebacterium uropygiale]|uniref:Magnesium transporter n=1 Tax=Corynebacterium uropygiale TaxID=1775911 RepID=A0A9X1QPS7_9CORY|nr:general stress protein [Corynebacterium uropygiale]MCF4006911.1 magnesium transporter [Corynebacterium uropygiale]
MVHQDPQRRASASLRERRRPTGWPVGSFSTYEQAQAAVDMLSDREFPVAELTIVGVDLIEVENVTGRLTWGKVLASGAGSGAWLGVFFGLLMGIFGQGWLMPLITGIIMGVIFGMIMVAVPYAATRGRRDFTSSSTIVAGRYDVICTPSLARQARDMIAESGIAGQPAPDTRAPRPAENDGEDA